MFYQTIAEKYIEVYSSFHLPDKIPCKKSINVLKMSRKKFPYKSIVEFIGLNSWVSVINNRWRVFLSIKFFEVGLGNQTDFLHPVNLVSCAGGNG